MQATWNDRRQTYMKYAAVLLLVAFVSNADPFLAVAAEVTLTERVSVAIRRAIPLLEQAAAGSARERKCFTCHSQALPVMAMAEARSRGFVIDEDVFESQLKHTAAHLKRGLAGYLKGKGQGGRVMTAGYALWTLEAGGRKSDETTAAVVHYLLEFQQNDQRWHQASSRPPSSGSDFANTYLALRALREFATDDQREAADSRIKAVGKWLLATNATETEDRVFRFRALPYVDANNEEIDAARSQLISAQRDDGGWSQKPDMTSDAYATGTVLTALLRDGSKKADSAIKRGVDYLLDSQLKDGSWHVATRATPFQPYFESGFPHEKDQFISTTATGWATIALTLTLPEAKPAKP
tara:strand:- start:124336 stop:125394 length:1059 start_codon:yes stop_codon:yes gene_type:complete